MEISKVSIVIPALNEEKAIGQVVKSLSSKFPEAEIIVVNDGSTDNTAKIAKSSGATKIITHEFQRGYGASLRTGTLSATREYVLFCDGDGQHSPDDVEKLIKEVDGYDLVIGVRGPDSYRSLI
ncbi:MAG: glycosyltransferase family 2 protein, partial [Deltaproteobacteria bacterium]